MFPISVMRLLVLLRFEQETNLDNLLFSMYIYMFYDALAYLLYMYWMICWLHERQLQDTCQAVLD